MHEFVIANVWEMPEVEQRKCGREKVGDAQVYHDEQQQIEQPMRYHRQQVAEATL